METKEYSKKIKKNALELVFRKRASHIGGSLSVADILAVLFSRVAKLDPKTPKAPDRDRLFFSKGHCCSIFYACLFESGFISKEEFEGYADNGSRLTAHVSHKVPGVELSTGSLGHAFPVACGVALALLKRSSPARVFCILSDGELNEGSNWEALMFAAHHQLKNICVIVDCNRIQSLGFTHDILNLEPLEQKLAAFNFDIVRIPGHHHDVLTRELAKETNRPRLIVADTVKGKGISFMENDNIWHYKSPSESQFEQALSELDKEYS
ncbi:MAG: transketolase [Bdellovibrionaceae bacterium]|nr:transketolase [Pseudobdellovibrionaceae bacterium]